MAGPGFLLRIPGEVHSCWMLEPWNRTNGFPKQWVAAFLNTAAFFSRKLKIAPSLQAGFTLSLFHIHLSVSFRDSACLWHTGTISEGKCIEEMIPFPPPHSLQMSPTVQHCFILRELMETSGILPIPICFTHFWKNKHHPHCKSRLQLLGCAVLWCLLFFFGQGNVHYIYDFLWIAHEILSKTALSSWGRILPESLLRRSLRSFWFLFLPELADSVATDKATSLPSSKGDADTHAGGVGGWGGAAAVSRSVYWTMSA